ncbi:hypothetical protein P7C70_g4167, partial [Phenoliferia sp. Uapishka_3]
MIPRFRILVGGETGAGKSTTINKMFNPRRPIDKENNIAGARDWRAGEHNVEHEHKFVNSPFFVFHDSNGFEKGVDTQRVALEAFVTKRGKETDIANCIHLIWYFVKLADRSVSEGDRKFLQMAKEAKATIIIVFTNWDHFEIHVRNYMGGSPTDENVSLEASKIFREKILPRLAVGFEDYVVITSVKGKVPTELDQQGYDNLVKMSIAEMSDPRLVTLFAAVQQVSADQKIEASIRCATYYQVAAVKWSAQFVPGLGVAYYTIATHRIYKETVKAWGLSDPENCLSWDLFTTSMQSVFSASGAFALAFWGLATGFIWDSPRAARFIMIVDLTLIFDHIFHLVRYNKEKYVTPENVKQALKLYKTSGRRDLVKSAIKGYMTNFAVRRMWNVEGCNETMRGIILRHRHDAQFPNAG